MEFFKCHHSLEYAKIKDNWKHDKHLCIFEKKILYMKLYESLFCMDDLFNRRQWFIMHKTY